MRVAFKRKLPVLTPVREIEIDGKGQNAETIHKEFERHPGFGGVTIRGGKTFVTYATDLDDAGLTLVRETEARITELRRSETPAGSQLAGRRGWVSPPPPDDPSLGSLADSQPAGS